MAEEEIDHVAQLRRLGVGIALGGLVLGALTVAGVFSIAPVLAVAGGLGALGLLVWWLEYRSESTVGVGLGIGVVGVLVALETSTAGDISPLELAAFAVVGGLADLLLAPVFVWFRDAGEKASGR